MEGLGLLGLAVLCIVVLPVVACGLCVVLWRRLQRLERVVAALGVRLEASAPATPAAATSSPAAPPSPVSPSPVSPSSVPLAAPEPPAIPPGARVWPSASGTSLPSETLASETPPSEATGLESPASPRPAASAGPPPDIEFQLTQRWGVWLGALALLFAGVFLIRYAVENALLGPGARCLAAAVLGAALLGAATFGSGEARQRRLPGNAAAALAAGGVAVLFGAAYGAGVFYALVPPTLGFALMAGASGLGLLASLRFGPLVAAVGLVGAFVTPALVNTPDPSMPGLFAYLLAVAVAALALMRWTAWTWLGWAATGAIAVWAGLVGATFPAGQTVAPALTLPVAAALHLALLPGTALEHPAGRILAWVPFLVLGVAGLWLDAVAGTAATRTGVLLLTPLALWRGVTEPRLDRLPWLAAPLFLLVLLGWSLPAWQPTGETLRVEGRAWAFLPGPWVPEAIVPLLVTATGLAALNLACGLWQERRAPRPLLWAGLAAAVPALALLIAYARVAGFQRDALWALAAVALAALLVEAARHARTRQLAGVHATGAAAVLALGCAMVLREQWLSLALALFLPALAVIAERAELSALRRVALVVAATLLARLLLNDWVLGYAFGSVPLLNALLLVYGLPAACCAWSAVRFRRSADDSLVAVLEGAAIAFLTALVVLELRHLFGHGGLRGAASATELAWQVVALAVQAAALRMRARRPVAQAAARVLGAAALAGGTVLLVANPAFVPVAGGGGLLVAGYLLPGLLAALVLSRERVPRVRCLLAAFVLAESFVLPALVVRLAFHPGHPEQMWLAAAFPGQSELWCYSTVWLVLGVGLLAGGMVRLHRALRLAGLAVLGVVTLKVFLLDMGALAGLWRVVSFLGLGLVLIGLAAASRRSVTRLSEGGSPPPA